MILSQDFPGVLLSQINKIRIKGRRYSLSISGSNLQSPHYGSMFDILPI